jgi:WD40 repeat protein
MRSLSILIVAFLACAGCGSSAPDLAEVGPRLAATRVAEWPAAGPAREAAFSRDGRLLALSDASGAITIRDTGSWRPLERLSHAGGATSVAFSSDGKQLASGSFDNDVRLWDVGGGRLFKTLRGHTQAMVGLDYSPDGSRLASGGDDSTIRLWRTSDGAALRTMNAGKHVDAVHFSADGKWLISGGHAHGAVGTIWRQLTGGGGDGDAVRVWRTADMAPITALPHPDDVISLAISPDGHWLVTSGEDSRFRLWRLGEPTS